MSGSSPESQTPGHQIMQLLGQLQRAVRGGGDVAQVTQNAVRGAIEAAREVGGDVDRPTDPG
jgi:hypothetical protein